MKSVKAYLILLVFILFLHSAGAQEKYSTVKIYTPSDRVERANLIGLLQIDHFQELPGGIIISEISASELNRLRATSYKYEILVDDVARKLDEVNRQYYIDKANGRLDDQNRVAIEQTGRTVSDIIPTPSAFDVQPTFGGYYSFAQMEAAMNSLVASYPAIAQKTSLGKSHENRDIWCIKISDQVSLDQANEPEVLFIGLQHAREAIGGSSMIFFMQYLCENYSADPKIRDLVDNREIFIIPCMNPDGWEYNRTHGGAGGGWRKNRRDNTGSSWGVDLNRNWSVDWSNCSAPIVGSPSSCGSNDPFDDTYYGPSSFSEPETRAIRDFTYAHHLVAMIDQHAYGPYYSLPFGRPSLSGNVMSSADAQFYTHIASAMGTYNGMRSGNSPQALGYEVAGGVKDWMLKGNIGTGTKGKVMGLTGEGGAGGGTGGSFGSFWAPASQITNLCKGMAYQNLQLLFSAGSYVNLQDKSDVSVDSRTGSFSFSVKRVGLEDRPVIISMIPLENIVSAGSPITISSLPNYGDTYTDNISFTLPAALEDGKRLRFAWKIETGGYTYYDTVTKFYKPIELFEDDMEGSNVNTNWNVSAGWNYTTEDAYAGNKSLTESPGGNYPANATRRATYTGVLDLSDATAALLSFWVKHRAENFYDKLQVKVSDDGGVSWTAIAGTTTVQEPGTLDGSTINGRPSLTGIKEDWTRELFDLSGWMNTSALRLRFEFTSGSSTSYDFSEDDGFHIDNIKVIKSNTPMMALPAHFISLTANLQADKSVRIDWNATIDQEHDYFEVERSVNGTEFNSIGRGSSSAPYWKMDPSPVIGNNFYRIRQVNKDGKTMYSQIVKVYFDPTKLNVWVYPNPVLDILTVKLNSNLPDRYQVTISDLTGRKVYEQSVYAAATGEEVNINFKPMAAQLYVLTVRNGRNEIIATQKVARQ
jgi:hypothetical protein